MKNKIPDLIALIFFLVGICMLISGFFAYKSNQQFYQSSQKTVGIVTDLVLDDSVYYPIFQFKTQTDEKINFKSSFGSNPPSYKVGDTAEIYYDPTDPYTAQVNDFGSNWLVIIIFGVVGFTLTSLGGFFILKTIRLRKNKKWMLQFGKRISSDFQHFKVNESFSINGSHPYIIVSQWQDQETKKVYLFESENIWYNPEKFITDKTIDVLVNPNNYKKYYMDIGFLPKLD